MSVSQHSYILGLERELKELKKQYERDCKEIKTQTVEERLTKRLERYEQDRKRILREIDERNRCGSFYGWAE